MNSGTTAIPAGDQSFTMQNPNYVEAVSTSGWTAQGTSNGAVTGVVQLVRQSLSLVQRLLHPGTSNGAVTGIVQLVRTFAILSE